MTIEDQIQSLIAHAEPLRALDDDDPAKAPLAGIVDEINRLRAVQEKQGREAPAPTSAPATPVGDVLAITPGAAEEGADAAPVKQRRKPGPKPKKGEQQ